MKYFKRLVLFTAAAVFIIPGRSEARTLLVEDFDRTSFVGPLGPHNVWMVNPDDPTSGVRAGFVRNDGGFALRIDYNTDSPITYYHDRSFIQDYSEFSVLGLADGLPHVAPGGYFFILGEQDLRGFDYLVFSARGDEKAGYTRRFQLELKTANRTSSFMFDGLTSQWRRYAVPLSVFDGIDDWRKVTEITISFNEHVTAERGAVYLDNLYFASDPDDVPLASGGFEADTGRQPFEYRYHPSAGISANFRNTPERGGEVFSSAEAVIQAQAGILTGRLRASVDSQEFGSAGYREVLDEYPYTRFQAGERGVSFPTVQLKVHGLTPLASRVTVGHLYLGYSPYLFNPFFGWNGIKVEGARDIFDHSTFIVKRHLNSFAAGSRLMTYAGPHRFQLLGVYDSETASLESSEGSPGVFESGRMSIRPVSDEFSWLANALFRFLDYRLNLDVSYADTRQRIHGTADYTDPSNPEFIEEGDFPSISDSMVEAKVFLNGLPLYGSRLLLSYRDVGTDFAPAYRQEPFLFEEIFADQRGFLVRAEQWYRDFGATIFYDTLDRISNSSYYRNVVNYGLRYRGPSDMELGLSREHKNERYAFGEPGDTRFIEPKDYRMTSLILNGRYNFFYDDTPGIRLPLTMTLELREDRIDNRQLDERETNHAMSLGLEYRMGAELSVSATYRASTRNNPSDFEDNILNIFISGNF